MSPVVEHSVILGELKELRRSGLVRLRSLGLPELRGIVAELPDGSVEGLIRAAVGRLDQGSLRTAAEYTLGLAPGTRDWPGADRRKRAAEVYGVSVERFRKDHELMVLGEVAEEIGRVARAAVRARAARAAGSGPAVAVGAAGSGTAPGTSAGAGTGAWTGAGSGTGTAGRPGTAAGSEPWSATGPGAGAPGGVGSASRGGAVGGAAGGHAPGHRVVTVRAGRREVALTVHAHPVDLLRDVDVVVSPVNTYLALPEPYKSSVSASLRRAAAVRGVTGDVRDDPLHDELRTWAARYDTSGRPVLPGTVASTGSGALAAQGIRRIYHAAIAVPRAGTNDYDVLPDDITRAADRVFGLLADEHDRFDPPLRSVCFPLLGSGRGGLPYATSASALWAAVEAELARGADWEVHLLVRGTEAFGDLLDRLPGIRPDGDPSPPGASG